MVTGKNLIDSLVAKRRAPFKAQFPLPVGKVGRKIHFIGRGYVTGGGVIDSGQLIAAPVPCPLIAAISRDWQKPIPIRANRRKAHWRPADIALYVRIDVVDGWRSRSPKRLLKLLKVLCSHESERGHVGRRAWFEPACSHRESTVLFFLHVNDRAMARESQLDRNCRFVSHPNFLVNYPEWLPLIVVLVLILVGGIQFIHIQVLLIDKEIRSSKRNPIVMSKRDCGNRRFADSDYMQGGCIQIGDIAQTGLDVYSVRIIGHDGAAGRRLCGRNYPIIAFCPGLRCGIAVDRYKILSSSGRG